VWVAAAESGSTVRSARFAAPPSPALMLGRRASGRTTTERAGIDRGVGLSWFGIPSTRDGARALVGAGPVAGTVGARKGMAHGFSRDGSQLYRGAT
jgi:hypothetical protein